MKSKSQAVSEEQARRDAIGSQKQGTSSMVIGGHIPDTSYDTTLAFITERSKKAAALRMQEAQRIVTVAVLPLRPEQPKAEPVKPEWGDEVADTILDSKGRVRKVGKRWFGITG
jgi:hypothetical protein